MRGKEEEGGNRTRKAVVQEHLQPIATALGILAMGWGALEQTISAIMVTMLHIPPRQGAIVAGNVELINQIRIIRSLAAVLKLSKPAYDDLKSSLSHVENKLCPGRNRMFHDLWMDSGKPGTMNRITLKPKIDPNNLEFKHEKIQLSDLEISDLSIDVYDTIARLKSSLKAVEGLFL